MLHFQDQKNEPDDSFIIPGTPISDKEYKSIMRIFQYYRGYLIINASNGIF